MISTKYNLSFLLKYPISGPLSSKELLKLYLSSVQYYTGQTNGPIFNILVCGHILAIS